MDQKLKEVEEEKSRLLARVRELEMQLMNETSFAWSDDNGLDEATGQNSEEEFLSEFFDQTMVLPQNQDDPTEAKVDPVELIKEIQMLPPPELPPKPVQKMSQLELLEENQRRFRFGFLPRPKPGKKIMDQPGSSLAPSIKVDPLPMDAMAPFEMVLQELGATPLPNSGDGRQPLYFADCRILSQVMLKDLVMKRAQHLVQLLEAKKVDQGTQTFITHIGKQYPAGCVNCKSKEHTFKSCKLPFRAGFCKICGAEGFDEEDCIYPHGIEHEQALGRCPGCARSLDLYCPECPDCNIRYEGLVDWLRLNYSTWPTWMIPSDHRYLVGEGDEVLNRRIKTKFDNPIDRPKQVRTLLVRENALLTASPSNETARRSIRTLSEEKRQRAVKAIQTPFVSKTLDQVFKDRPELDDGAIVKVVVPKKYQKKSTK